jgi:outer membrane protein assembly factor BamB
MPSPNARFGLASGKRIIGGILSVLVLAALVPSTSIAAPRSRDLSARSVQWPKFHYDLASTGFNPHETILSQSTVGALQSKWIFPAGGLVVSSPAVVGGVVYTADSEGDVYAIDAESGSQVWHAHHGGGSSEDPAVSRGSIFLGSIDDDGFRALDARTGAQRWSLTLRGPVGTPSVVGNTVYVASDLGSVYAIRASDGTIRWEKDFEGGTYAGLALHAGTIYVGDSVGNCARALDAGTGEVIWIHCVGNQIYSTPVYAQGRVFISARDGNVYALDASTGGLLWIGVTGTDNFSSAAAAYGMIFIGAIDGKVYAFPQDCAATCTPTWTFQTGDQIVEASPAVANGVVYIGSEDHNVYALDARTGEELWHYTAGGFFNDAPAVVDGVLYIGCLDDNLYAFALPASG